MVKTAGTQHTPNTKGADKLTVLGQSYRIQDNQFLFSLSIIANSLETDT